MAGKYSPAGAIYVRSLGGDKTRGILQCGAVRLPCALGRGGISAFKREGDGATPRAFMTVLGGFCQNPVAGPPRCGLKLRRTGSKDGWCDAPQDPNYNRLVRLPYAAGAEPLNRADGLYAVGFILDWNSRPRIKGRGSAVFFHIARPKTQTATEGRSALPARKSSTTGLFHPTAGCIAVSAGAMRRLAPYLKRGAKFAVLG